MKKTTFISSVLAFIVTGSLAFSFGGRAPQIETIKGHINYYGNAPFETPAFVCDDGKIYLMETDETKHLNIEEILALQGYHIELTGTLESEQKELFPIANEGTIVISEYKLVK